MNIEKFNCDCMQKFKDYYKKECKGIQDFEIEPFYEVPYSITGNKVEIIYSLPMTISYREIKKSGEPYKNKTRIKSSYKMNYCPVCGKKLNS